MLSILLIQAGCSSFTERSPAQVDSKHFHNAFSFSATVKGKTNHKDTIDKVIADIMAIGVNYPDKKAETSRAEFVASKTLAQGEAFHLELDIDPKTSQLIYRIFHAPDAFQDDIASYALMNFLSKTIGNEKLDTNQAIFEMYYNAKRGDPIALDNFFKMHDTKYGLIYGIDNNIFNSDDYKKNSKKIETQRSEITSEILI